ncbi:MAG: response regulator [Oscillospiraceae bacterium]|nr:response regulator [Oscillospiraceae bacterium]
MIALTVDDERLMLTTLTAAVKASPDISSVTEFTSCSKALEWAETNTPDIAFLDISMRGMGGLTLAEKLLALHPQCKIIFCTGYSEYAVDAFRIHVSGYLMKPITAQQVQREIDHIKGQKSQEKLLTIQCFGNFEVMCKGQMLRFKRTRSKEVLAIMVDRHGARLNAKTICAIMWPDSEDDTKNANYLHQLFIDLRNALRAVGAEEIFQQNGYQYSLDTQRIDCDYFNFLKTGKPPFRGEYMSQYSWAEETCALLWRELDKDG